MDLNSSITEDWDTRNRQAQQEWKAEIRNLLEPELESRGITITSASSLSVDGTDFHHFLICEAANGAYIEIRASSKQGFAVSVVRNDEPSVWPTVPLSTYDRKNYTLHQLINWLDTQSWKE